MKVESFKVLVRVGKMIVVCFIIVCLILMIWFDVKFWFKMLCSDALVYAIFSSLDDDIDKVKAVANKLKKGASKNAQK